MPHLELLRVLAIFLVVWNHSPGYLYYLTVRTQPIHWPLMMFSAFDKIGVSLFFMISGALLLPKTESLSSLLRKRVLRCLLVLLLFSLASHLYDLHREGQPFSLYFFLSRLYAYRLVHAYWYLYTYLGFLLALPFLRHIAERMDGREWCYLLGLMVLTQGLDFLQVFLLQEELFAESSFQLFPLSAAVFFPLLGFFLEYRLPTRWYRKKYLFFSFLLALFTLLLIAAATERGCLRSQDWSSRSGEIYFSRFSFLVAGAVYFQAKYLFRFHAPSAATARVLAIMGSCSFGIFLLQHFLISPTYGLVHKLSESIGMFPASLVQTLLICLVTGFASFLLKQIPGLRRLL